MDALRRHSQQLELKNEQLTIQVEELKKNNAIFCSQIAKGKEEKDEEVSKVSSELKKMKFSYENLMLDLEACQKKLKESEAFLMTESLKSKKIAEELVQTREKQTVAEQRLKTTLSAISNSNPQSPLLPQTFNLTSLASPKSICFV